MAKISLSASTDIGNRRSNNEDSFIVTNDVSKREWSFNTGVIDNPPHGVALVIADGMGGEVAGEKASKITIRTVQDILSQILVPDTYDGDIISTLNKALVQSHENIVNTVKTQPEYYGMGTTGTICYIKGSKLFISWVGDSRVYRYSPNGHMDPQNFAEGNLEILTNDHSKVWEYVMAGHMTPEEARVAENSNIITRSLGDMSSGPITDNRIYQLYDGDIVLACSDGLNGMVSDSNILKIFKSESDLQKIKDKLIQIAKDAGGYDNITVSLCRIESGGTPIAVASKTDDYSNKEGKSKNEIIKPASTEAVHKVNATPRAESHKPNGKFGVLKNVLLFLLAFAGLVTVYLSNKEKVDAVFLNNTEAETSEIEINKEEENKIIAIPNAQASVSDSTKTKTNKTNNTRKIENSEDTGVTSSTESTLNMYNDPNVKARLKEIEVKFEKMGDKISNAQKAKLIEKNDVALEVLKFSQDSLMAKKEYLKLTKEILDEIGK